MDISLLAMTLNRGQFSPRGGGKGGENLAMFGESFSCHNSKKRGQKCYYISYSAQASSHLPSPTKHCLAHYVNRNCVKKQSYGNMLGK